MFIIIFFFKATQQQHVLSSWMGECMNAEKRLEALGWAKMLCFLKEQGGEIHPFHSLAASLPALSHGLVKGSREAELTIYLPFIFGRNGFGIKIK